MTRVIERNPKVDPLAVQTPPYKCIIQALVRSLVEVTGQWNKFNHTWIRPKRQPLKLYIDWQLTRVIRTGYTG